MDEIKRAILGDRAAQERLTERGVLLPCPTGCKKNGVLHSVTYGKTVYAVCPDCGVKTPEYKHPKLAVIHWNTHTTILSVEELEAIDGNYEYKSMPDSMEDALEKIKAEQYAEYRSRSIGQFVSDHSGGANKMVDVCGKDNNVSTNIDLEAWEPCELCGRLGEVDPCYKDGCFKENAPKCDFRCDKFLDWRADKRRLDGAMFCPKCGRPLTPEARAMLEKRLRG